MNKNNLSYGFLKTDTAPWLRRIILLAEMIDAAAGAYREPAGY